MRKCFSRALAFTMAILVLVSQLVVVSVAEIADYDECVCAKDGRTGSLYDSVAPTCGDYGYDIMICDVCGGTYLVFTELPTGEHVTNITEPTCEEDVVCMVCEQVIEEAFGHDYVETVYEADCENDGYTYYECANCGDNYTTGVVEASGHDYAEVDRKESSCYVDGVIVYACQNDGCQATYEEVIEAPEKHINYVKVSVPATCTKAGYFLYTCNVCGFELEEVNPDAPALDHNDLSITPAVPPTCTEIGYTEGIVCNICGEVRAEVTPVEALGHEAAEPVRENVVNPSCQVEGSYEAVTYCVRCGEEMLRTTEVIPVSEHDMTVTTVDPTCTERGYDLHECTKCDYEYADNYTDALDHDYVVEVTAPTCKDEGYTETTCTRCDYYVKSDVVAVDPLAHDGEIVGRVEATCTADGTTGSVTCKYCGKILAKAQVIPMVPHTLIETEAKAATCTEIGWNAYVTCDACGYTTYEEIAALGHTEGDVVRENVVNATCLNDGSYDAVVYCTVCGEELSREATVIEALGHDKGETLGVTLPTCEDEGYSIYKCLRTAAECENHMNGDGTYRDDFVPAMGHEYVGEVTTEPTCTTLGVMTYTCTKTEGEVHTYDEEIDMLPHNTTSVEAKDATCTEAGWGAYEYCNDCDYTTFEEIAPYGHTEIEHAGCEATCEADGWADYVTCEFCDYTTYQVIPATGHTEGRPEIAHVVPATCTSTGSYEEVVYCVTCRAILAEPVVVVTPMTPHTPDVHVYIEPTETTIGYEEIYCSECDALLETIPVNETIEFSYEVSGINGVEYAVNSGYITVEVYADVLTDYARFYGIDYALSFGSELTFVDAESFGNPSFLSNYDDNAYVDAYGNNVVKFTTDNGMSGTKAFAQGKYLIATLTFKVAGDFYAADTFFGVVSSVVKVSRDTTLENHIDVLHADDKGIHVYLLGDGDFDGKQTTLDTNLLYEWAMSEDADANPYNFMYDMDKDGDIDGEDFNLLRKAIVNNNEYLEK